MKCSKRYLAIAAVALAACGQSADLETPAPAAVVPSTAHTVQPVRIEIRGDHFNLVGERHLARGSDLDASFHATLGGVPLTDVRWVDNHTLAATVPAGLSGDPLDLVLDGPTGHAVLPAAFRASAAPAAALSVSAAPPAQVALSQQFQVSVTIANTGGTTASHVLPSLSGAGISVSPLASDLTIDAGQSRTLVYLASSSTRGAATFAAAATGLDAFSGETVTAQGAAGSSVLAPAVLRASPRALPATMSVGKQFTIAVDVTNDGDADATAVSMVDPQAAGTGRVDDLGSPPSPQPIPAGQTRTFEWAYLAAAPGDLVLGCSGTAIDALTGALLAVSTSWPQILIQTPASLSSTASVPSTLSVSDQATLRLDVTNSGDGLATAVVPSLTIGGSAVAVVSGPAVQDVPGHASRTFLWQIVAVSAGSATLALQAGGVDANSGAAVSTSPPVQPTIAVQTQAQLSAKGTAPVQVSVGQSFQVSLDVSDLGDAGAGTVSATAACTPANLLSQTAVPGPAAVAGQQTQIFAWTFLASAPGQVDCQLSASGADVNDGHPVNAIQAVSILVQRPPALRITSFAVPAAIDRGQSFTATLVVANTGGVTARGVVVSPDPPQVVATGGASATANPSSGAQDIPGGGTASFSFTFVESGTGTGSLVLHAGAFGSDANSGTVATAQPVDSSSIAVHKPAALVSTVTVATAATVGDEPTLQLDVTNTGETTALGVTPSLDIVGAGISVLSAPPAQDVPGQTTRSFVWQIVAVSAGNATLGLQARGADANSGAAVSTAPPVQPTIAVQTPPQLTAKASAPVRVSTGQSFPVSIDVSDLGDAGAGTVSATAACSPATLLSQSAAPNPISVGGHQTQTFAWTFAAVSAGTVNCTLTASGADVNNSHPVSATETVSIQIQRAAVLQITRFPVPATVSRGQSFTATLVVANTGEATARGVVASPDPPQVIAAALASATASPSAGGQDIPGGGSASFTFTFVENGRGTGSLVLHAGAFGADANSGSATSAAAVDSTSIGVQAPASLLVTRVSVPPSIDRGQAFPVTVEITNTGGATAVDVLPSPLPLSLNRTGGASATTTTFESGAVIAPGDKATFDFAYLENGSSAGSLVFSASASGTDANSGEPLLAAALPSAALAVQDPPLLVVSRLVVPAAVSRGQVFTVSGTVVNNGGATARCVRPNSDSLSVTVGGAASVQLGSGSVVTSPGPTVQGACPPGASGPDLASGQSATFSWTATENGTGSGSLVFAGTAGGIDANTSAALSTAQVSATTKVMTPPLLSVDVRPGPSSITRTQHFTTTVVVTNHGEATALNVNPVASPSTFPAPGGGASAITTSSPLAVAIASGGTASFVYDFVENGTSSGTLQFSAGASGTDANSLKTVSAAEVAAPAITVLDKTQLLIESFSIPATLSRGQAFSLSIRVTNVSSGTLADVAPSPNPPDQNTTGFASASVAAQPPVASLDPGASATFTYPCVENGTGTGTLAFSGTVSAIDVATSVPVSANTTSTGTAVVENPAALAIRSFSLPATVSRGQTFTASLVVANTGGAAATGVLPDPVALTASGLAHAAVKAASAAQDIGAGDTATFSFTLVEDGTGPGSLQLGTKARGSDVNSAAQAISTLATTGTTVQEPGHLTVSQMSVPATISRGQSFTVSVTVTNDGGATVQDIAQDSSSPSVTLGGSAAVPVLKTATPGKSRLDAGQSTTFFWTWQDASTSSGNLAFVATIAGSDVNSSAPLAVAAAPATTTVQNPAALSVASLTLAPPTATGCVDRGQSFAVTLVVANTGEATATNVLPSPSIPAVLATGQASASTPTGQAGVSIAGGSSKTFTWTYLENGTGPGALQVSAGAVGADANSGDTLTAPAATSNLVSVVSPPVLSAQSFTLPSSLSRGQTFTALLVVANTGGSAAASVLPEPPVLATTGGAHATATSSPAAATIAAGASAPFTWNYVEDGSAAGTIALATRASGTDANTASPVSSGSISTAAVPVLEPASLVMTGVALLGPSGAPAVDRGQAATATMTVKNAGGSAARGVALSAPVLTATGGANAIVSALPGGQDIAPGQSATYTVSLTENGSGKGTLQISFGAAGTDASSGLPVSASAVSSNVLQVQAPAALAGALSAPSSALLGETFTVSFTVTNGGDGGIRSLSPSLSVDSAAVTVVSGPAPATTLAAGESATYAWSLLAAAPGTANVTASVLGTAVNTGSALSVTSTASLVVGEAALVATNPFGDGSTFANLFAYQGSLYVGPNKAGTGGSRMQPDGTGREALSFTLNDDTTGFKTANTAPGPFASFGTDACTKNTLACGPDNENGRGFFGTVSFQGEEWLIGSGALSVGNLFHFYATTDATTAPDFSYVDVSVPLADGLRAATAAVAFGDRVYVGFSSTGAARPALVALTKAPAPPGLDATNTDVINFQGETIPAIGKSAKTSLIDTLVAFNDRIYAFNNGGCARSVNAQPAAGSRDWVDCTPSDPGYVGKTSQATNKSGDLVPADKAFPAVVAWNGRLFAARNTNLGPQLWMCDPGADLACDPADWRLLAANGKLDPKLSQFDDNGNHEVSLLAATASHLYVGFDNPNGVQLYAAATATPVNRADFAGSGGCNAAQSTCAPIGGAGLGVGAKQFFDGKSLTFPSGEQLFVAAGDGVTPVRLFRFPQ